MADKKNPLGPTGEAVRAAVAAHRARLNLGYAELSRRLEAIGRPIPVLGLSRIEKGERRVDVDDLVALAYALEVTPLTLLTPKSHGPDDRVEATGVNSVAALDLWQWMRTDLPLGKTIEDVTENLEFQWRSKPPWMKAEVVDRHQRYTSDHLRVAADRYDAALSEPERSNGDS